MLETISEHKSHNGTVGYYRHDSQSTNCSMRFAVYVPEHLTGSRLPILTYLAGLTCTEETFMTKAGALRLAAQHEVVLVAPDTSPRGEEVPDSEDWDFGQGAGFYLDASEQPWDRHFNMYSYVTQELQELVVANFPVDLARQGIFGHSMGGHGALVVALKNPGQFKSVSAFAPICAPRKCPWGRKAFRKYLGANEDDWKQFDATELMRQLQGVKNFPEILIDQGMDDQFLDDQLHPSLLERAAEAVGYPLILRRQEGYDHGYFFISTFMADHFRHHMRYLKA